MPVAARRFEPFLRSVSYEPGPALEVCHDRGVHDRRLLADEEVGAPTLRRNPSLVCSCPASASSKISPLPVSTVISVRITGWVGRRGPNPQRVRAYHPDDRRSRRSDDHVLGRRGDHLFALPSADQLVHRPRSGAEKYDEQE